MMNDETQRFFVRQTDVIFSFFIRPSLFENTRVTAADVEQTAVAAFRPWRGS
jgi:hypothetical protein